MCSAEDIGWWWGGGARINFPGQKPNFDMPCCRMIYKPTLYLTIDSAWQLEEQRTSSFVYDSDTSQVLVGFSSTLFADNNDG